MKLIFLIVVLYIASIKTYDYKNPYSRKFFEVILDRVEVIHEISSIIEWHIQIKKVNKIRSVVGYLTFHEPMGNNFIIGGKTLKKQGGEYRYLPYSLHSGPFCDVLAKDDYVYPDVARQSDFPDDIANNCPLPAGNYSFHGTTANLDKIPSMIAGSGEYAGELSYYKDDQIIATYRIFMYINNI